jgi:hypothetical protein
MEKIKLSQTLESLITTGKVVYKQTYRSTGLVYGKYWGGGEGAYQAKYLKSNSKEDLIEQAEKGLDGSLDAGMGYESLIGALLNIETISTVIIDGIDFDNSETELVFIGKLSEQQQDFLQDNMYN